jgi:signal transduction histidine kinase
LAFDFGQKQDGVAPAYLLNAITLKFKDAATERRYHVDHVIQALPIVRAAFIASALAYAMFGVLDVNIIPGAWQIAAWIRFAVVCPVLLGMVGLTYAKFFPRFAQFFFAVAMVVAGLGIVAMVAVADGPGKSTYYAGLILIIIVGSSLLPVRWIVVTVVSAIIFTAYQVVIFKINSLSPVMRVNNDFFLSTASLFGIVASYLQELKIRRIFIRDEGLRIASKQSDELRVKAEAASKAKSEFLAVMSHELRTPLNAILGFTEIMKLRLFGAIGSDRYGSYVEDIHQSARHLLNIVTDILDLSKAEVGKLSLEEGNADTFAILDECLRLLREWAGEQGVRLSLDLSGIDPPIIFGDTRLIKQVFLNVLSNAIKFTPAAGSVSVVPMRGPDGCLAIEFRDTGIGIAEGDIAAVLEPFVQVESAFARKHGGTGLGLPLVKKIMELHGGAISLKSTLGAGTTVTLIFPAERIMIAPAEQEPPENAKIYAR